MALPHAHTLTTLNPTHMRSFAFRSVSLPRGSTCVHSLSLVAVKHQLDDTAASYFTDALGMEEDYYSSNLKLGIMGFACAVALLAQFFPVDYSWYGRYLVGACCILYFVSSVVLQLVYWVVDGDVIFKTVPDGEDGGRYIVLRSRMERYEDDWTVVRFGAYRDFDPSAYGPSLHATGIPLDHRLPARRT